MQRIHRRKSFWTTLGVAALATTLAACSGAGSPSDTASPGAGGTDGGDGGGSLNILMVGNPQMTDLEGLAPDFEEESGIDLNITILPENELRDRVAQDVSTGAGQYDVVTIGAYEGSVWTANDWLHNLQDMAEQDEDFDVDDLMPAMKGVLSKDDDLYAIPFYGESAFTMYRKDIFDEHGLTMPDEPTWEDIEQLAAQIKEAEPEMTPVCMRGLPGWGENMAVVGSMLNAFGGGFFNADWENMINSPETTEAVQFYVDLVKNYGEEGATNAGFTECLNIFSQGEAAMWFDATSAANSVESPTSSTVVGKVGYADAPRQEARSGWVWAWAWGVPKTTKNLDAAWEFISWASGKEYEQKVGEELGWTRVPDGKRLSTFEIPEYQEATEAYRDKMLAAIEQSDPNDCGTYPRPAPGCQYLAIPEFADLGTRMGQEVSAALAGQKSVEDALQASYEYGETAAERHR
ncbi:ABC transporter substrate-binding protein [Tessaracoccus oleiagri]|uniref:Sorbitol/mannitol transport system substrate-binding protein n=1 Tax=Tessaracoccus oleiagri TaxID=686624 RepID=A0A1G9ICZ6_9ACTN|nr:sugar ABC transporter substrate-binding protein [Tessaracoccus oleiagri]SDL23087.1 sorbitol/mannitol transport system substrate-binding protein [Tessaracoccus oleiagri]